MLLYSLILPVRCHCGAVSFHVAVCPGCGERVDKSNRGAAFPFHYSPKPAAPEVRPELPSSPTENERLRNKHARSAARESIERIKRERDYARAGVAKHDRWHKAAVSK